MKQHKTNSIVLALVALIYFGLPSKTLADESEETAAAIREQHLGVNVKDRGSIATEAADEVIHRHSAPADNSVKNARDRLDVDAKTSGDQGNSDADRTLAASIRRAVVADDSLSIYAHNIKIIVENGSVTLRGPVRSSEEHKEVVAKAEALAGKENVDDQLEVARR